MLARLARDLPGWLRRPVTLDAARARIRRGLATREARFLALAEQAIYRRRRSPYRALLAELERGDEIDRHTAQVWRRLETVRVSREAPLAGPSGKVLPFQLARGATSITARQ